jgi:AbrB family looped-hinge helix DNA binding protein
VRGDLALRLAIYNAISTESVITTRGRVTIPEAVRKYLGLNPGDRVKFLIHPSGRLLLLPKVSASASRGMIKSRRKTIVSVDEMSQAAVDAGTGVPQCKTKKK